MARPNIDSLPALYANSGSTLRFVRASALSLPLTTSTPVNTMFCEGAVRAKEASQAAPAARLLRSVPPAILLPPKSRAHQVSVTFLSVAEPLTTCALSVIVCPAAL